MRPVPRASIPGITSRQHRKTPSRLTSCTCHQSSGSTFHVAPSGPPTPAFATKRSIGSPPPISNSTLATIRATSSRFETSPTTASPPISSATRSTCSRVLAETATRMPAEASSRAMFAPMPRPPPVTSAICPSSSGNRARDLVEGIRVLERGQVAGILAEHTRADGSAHDLGAARLGERRDEHDPLRLEGLPQLVRYRGGDLLRPRRRCIVAGLQDAEDPGDLALHVVRNADRRRLGDGRVGDRRGLELGGADALARDVERVVGTPVEEPVAVLVDRGPVSVCPHAREALPVRIQETLVVAPDAAGHPGPRAFAHELTDLAAHGFPLGPEDVQILPQCREAERNRLHGLRDTGGEEARADLGPARLVDDRNATAADPLEQPEIRVSIPRLACRADRLQGRHVGVGIAFRDQCTNQRRRDAEHRYALILDQLPEAVR